MEDRTRFDAEQREERVQRREEQRARRRDNKRREAQAHAAASEPDAVVEPVGDDTSTLVEKIPHRRRPWVAEVRDEVDTSVPDGQLETAELVADWAPEHSNDAVEEG
ncbi:MAG: hypothetical protein HGA45_43025 [Chloroflexales bacterium]|nr:hypothetical protein [Chloroflexales bacterium]